MSFPPDQLAAMSPEDRERVRLSDANAAGITSARRRMALALLAPAAPARVVRQAFARLKRDRTAGGGSRAD